MSKERLKVKFAVYLIPRDGNRVLLSLRKGTGWMDGYYSLVAGHVEAGETAEEALIREAKEESGIILRAENAKFVHVMQRLKDDPNDSYIDMFFESEKWDGEITNTEPEKCGGLDWYDIDSVPDNTLGYIKDVLTMSRTGVHYSSRRSEA